MKYTFILLIIPTMCYSMFNSSSLNGIKDGPMVNIPLSTLERTPHNTSFDNIYSPSTSASSTSASSTSASKKSKEQKSKRQKSASLTRVPYSKFNEYEKDKLIKVFEKNKKPNTTLKISLAKEFGVSKDKIQNWFQNRRRYYNKAVIMHATIESNINKTPTNEAPLIDQPNTRPAEEADAVENHIINLNFQDIIALAKIGYIHKQKHFFPETN